MESDVPARIAYEVFEPKDGADETLSPMIFGHALLLSKESWGDIPQILADKTKRKAFSLDARNNGDSEWAEQRRFDTHANDLLHFMNTNGIKKAVLIAHSMTGRQGILAALKCPERFEMLFIEEAYVKPFPRKLLETTIGYVNLCETIVSEIPHYFDEDDAYVFIKESIETITSSNSSTGVRKMKSKTSMPFALKRNPEGRYCMKSNTKEIIRGMTLYCRVTSKPDPEGLYEGPAYFIYGTESHFRVYEHIEHIKKYFPNAEFFPMEGVTHAGHLDYPEWFTELVLKRILKPAE